MWGLLLLLASLPASAAAAECGTGRIDDRVQVRFVYDGDTVFLADGRHLRLIGIDAPEMGRDGSADQPFAVAARDALRRLLFTHGHTLALRYGQERQDRYGRLLAHAYLDDGTSVEAALLAQGLATVFPVPPNVWHLDCYAAVAGQARRQQRGLWGLPAYRPRDSRSLNLHTRGFVVVQGRVIRVAQSMDAVWINLEGRFALRIPRPDLHYFGALAPASLQGSRVEARGMVYPRHGELRMTIRYPTQLTRLPPTAAAGYNGAATPRGPAAAAAP